MQEMHRKMGLAEKKVAPGLAKVRSGTPNSQTGYGGIGKRGKDIMMRGEKNSIRLFQASNYRKNRSGWDKRELARRMAEKINIINNVESGKRPTDAVIRKLERTLDIVLMVDASPDENRHVNSGQMRGLTLGDFLLGDKE